VRIQAYRKMRKFSLSVKIFWSLLDQECPFERNKLVAQYLLSGC